MTGKELLSEVVGLAGVLVSWVLIALAFGSSPPSAAFLATFAVMWAAGRALYYLGRSYRRRRRRQADGQTRAN